MSAYVVYERSRFSMSAWRHPLANRASSNLRSVQNVFWLLFRDPICGHVNTRLDIVVCSTAAATAPAETFSRGPCAGDRRTQCWFNCRTVRWRDLHIVVFDVLAPCSSHNVLPKGHTYSITDGLFCCLHRHLDRTSVHEDESHTHNSFAKLQNASQ